MENKNMNELEKMIAAVNDTGLKHEIVEDGMVVHLRNCVLVTAYWDWSDLLTNIYMSEDAYQNLLNDMKTADTKLSLPVFAFTYGYGYIDSEIGCDSWNVTPFYNEYLTDEHIDKLMEWYAKLIQSVGNPNESDLIYRVVSGFEDTYCNHGMFNDFFKARDALRKFAENMPRMKNWSPFARYRLGMSKINVPL